MKKYLLLIVILGVAFSPRAQVFADSIRIFKANDTMYCLGVYGVVNPTPPCTIIDSVKEIGTDFIHVSICYRADAGNQVTCRASDTLYLGNLSAPFYSVSVALAIQTTFVTCQTAAQKDTFTFFYGTTGIDDASGLQITMYPNPAINTVTVYGPWRGNTEVRLMGMDGKEWWRGKTGGGPLELILDGLPAGIYLLVAMEGEQRLIKRLVKQ